MKNNGEMIFLIFIIGCSGKSKFKIKKSKIRPGTKLVQRKPTLFDIFEATASP